MEARAASDALSFELPASHQPFRVAGGQADLSLSFLPGAAPPAPEMELLFDSTGPWRLHRQEQHYRFSVSDPESGPVPFRVAVLEPGFARGRVYCPTLAAPAGDPSQTCRVNPFEYPLDEVILVHFLWRGRGLHVHAGGVVDDGRGFLFSGPSGAGKSTLTRLWQPAGVTLLSDDRLIIRRQQDHWRVFGTPWHGDFDICSPDSAPLEKIFFLTKGPHHAVRRLPEVEAASRLLANSFPPFYDREALNFLLDFIARVTAEVPCYELQFVPEAGVVEFIRGVG